jgi:hypothetical protein
MVEGTAVTARRLGGSFSFVKNGADLRSTVRRNRRGQNHLRTTRDAKWTEIHVSQAILWLGPSVHVHGPTVHFPRALLASRETSLISTSSAPSATDANIVSKTNHLGTTTRNFPEFFDEGVTRD